MDKYTEVVDKLEEKELESADEDLYKQLYVYYLLQDKLVDGKFLYARLPGNLKENPELQRLDILRKALNAENTFEFFKNLEFEWSSIIAPLLKELSDKIRRNIFDLVGNAYATIYEKNLRHMTYMSSEELEKACNEMEWRYERNDQCLGTDTTDELIIIPKFVSLEEDSMITSENQLEELTEFISFLEN